MDEERTKQTDDRPLYTSPRRTITGGGKEYRDQGVVATKKIKKRLIWRGRECIKLVTQKGVCWTALRKMIRAEESGKNKDKLADRKKQQVSKEARKL